MSKWFLMNALVLLFAAGKLLLHPAPIHYNIPMLVGFIGLLFFLFNWTRQAVFATIRNVPDRNVKIKYAQLSKKVMPYHRWTGSAALLFILLHIVLVIHRYGGISIHHAKMMSGLAAGICLLFMVTSGWIRLYYPTVKMRKIHLYLGMTLFFLVVVHLLF